MTFDLQRLLQDAPAPKAVAFLDTTAAHSPWHMAPHVASFRQQAAHSIAGNRSLTLLPDARSLADWAKHNGLAQIVTPYAAVGPVRSALSEYQSFEDAPALSQYWRALDEIAWPLATKGFFPFRKHIPRLIDACMTAKFVQTS